MTDETEGCMSGWDVPSEIDRLALARRVYVEHARASKGNIQDEWVGDVMAGEADHLHGVRIAQRAIDTLLTDLAENPPQCAVEAMAHIQRKDGCVNIHLPPWAAKAAFTAAINAIRGET